MHEGWKPGNTSRQEEHHSLERIDKLLASDENVSCSEKLGPPRNMDEKKNIVEFSDRKRPEFVDL